MSTSPHPTAAAAPRARHVVAIAAALAAAGVLASCGDAGASLPGAGASALAEVLRGRLTIEVVEGGNLQSSRPITIRSTLEGRVAILEIVPEGSFVRKGQVIVVLDSAALQDRLNLQEIEVATAASELAQAEEALSIQQMQSQEDLATARCARDLAQQALQAYEEGTRLQERRKLQSACMLAEERLVRARTRATASRTLYEQQFISRSELEADEIAEKQAEEELKLARGDLEQYDLWTTKGELLRLRTELEVAKIAHQRVTEQCRSEEKQKEGIRDTARRSYELKVAARDKLREQIAAGIIRAPQDGLVIYAEKDDDDPPISKGREVREREEILLIPDLSDLLLEVEVHESSVKKVKVGQRAWISVDALPNRSIAGTVTHVSVVPASQSRWWNPDLKVYKTMIHLDELPEGLKPGMHATAEILIDELEDAIQIPLQAVRQVGSRSFVYLAGGATPELREVVLGQHSFSHVHVLEGLTPGELVHLALPASAPPLPAPAPEARPAPAPAARPVGPPDPVAFEAPGLPPPGDTTDLEAPPVDGTVAPSASGTNVTDPAQN